MSLVVISSGRGLALSSVSFLKKISFFNFWHFDFSFSFKV